MVAHLLEEAGVDMLDVSIMTYATTEYMSPNGAVPNGFNQFATQKIREVVDIPVMAVGRITPAMGDEMLRTGKCDLIAIGRGSLAEPALPNKLAEGKIDEIAPLIDEAKVSIECEMDGNYELENFDHFICKILATYVDEAVLNEKGKIDYHVFKPALFEFPTYEYFVTGDKIGDCAKMNRA